MPYLQPTRPMHAKNASAPTSRSPGSSQGTGLHGILNDDFQVSGLAGIDTAHDHRLSRPLRRRRRNCRNTATRDRWTQDSAHRPAPANLRISDDQIARALEGAQLRFQRERGTDLTIFSPRASAMAHHRQRDHKPQLVRACNDLIQRALLALSSQFRRRVPAPQSPGRRAGNSAAELERCVKERDSSAASLNPDPSGGHWSSPPLTDRHWYPLPRRWSGSMCLRWCTSALIQQSNFHATGAHYINADTTAFMQFLTSDLFKGFPICGSSFAHGGGAMPIPLGPLSRPGAGQ